MKAKKVSQLTFNDPQVAIKVEHLFCVYNEDTENQIVSLCDNNLELQKNKIHFIIGSSGCGKSTLVNHFNGLTKSRYGNVLVQNNCKIGQDFFIQNLLLGVLKTDNLETYLNISKFTNKTGYYVAFNNKLPKALIKIIFEAYYKIKIEKVFSLQTKKNLQAKYYFLRPTVKDYSIDVIDSYSIDELEAKYHHEPTSFLKFWFKKFGRQRKIKKIRNLKKTVGVVFQFPEYQLFKDTVLKDVMFGPLTLGIDAKTAKEKAIENLNKLGISNTFLDRSPFDMSGGQKRRVAISGILAFDPEIIIFDEPTAGLDPAGEREILQIIQSAKNDGKTVVVISHNMDHVLEKADNVIVMNDGEIIQVGTPYEIFTNHEILALTSLEKPKIINIIEELVKREGNFQQLWNSQPRTIEQLASQIARIAKKKI